MVAFLSVVICYYDNDEVIDRKFISVVIKLDDKYINRLVEENQLLSFIKEEPFINIPNLEHRYKQLVDNKISMLSKYKVISKTNSLAPNYPSDYIEFKFSAIDAKAEVIREIKEIAKVYNKAYVTNVNGRYTNIINNARNEKRKDPIKLVGLSDFSNQFILSEVYEKLEQIPKINIRSQIIFMVLSILMLIPFALRVYSYSFHFHGVNSK